MNWHDWGPAHPSVAEAFDAWREGDLARARLLLDDAGSRRPHDPDVWRGLGGVAWTEERLGEALDHFTRALQLAPASPMSWHNVGVALRDLGDRDRALRMFAVALDLDDRYEPAANEIGNVLVEFGRPADALDWYDRALAFDGTRAVVWHNRGVCHRLMGREAEAVADFVRALELHPGYHHTVNELQRAPAPARAVKRTTRQAARRLPSKAVSTLSPSSIPPAVKIVPKTAGGHFPATSESRGFVRR